MTLRSKFILALIGMVIFMAIIFMEIALFSVKSYVRKTEDFIQQGYTQQWNRILTTYYLEHNTWEGIDEYISHIFEDQSEKHLVPPREAERLIVFDLDQKVVAASQASDLGKELNQFPKEARIAQRWFPIEVNGTLVGHFWLDNKIVPRTSRLVRGLADSIMRGLVFGLIITSLVAVILGIIFTRRLTVPLRDLTDAVRRVGEGDYTPRVKVQGKDDIALLGRAFNRMIEQLVRNEEARRNMVADVAHELRTPLSVISGKLESIQQGVLPATPENLLPIQDETIRLIRLVRDLQQLNLAEAGKLPLVLQQVDLNNLVGRIIEQFAIEFDERQIQAEIHGEKVEIEADPDRLTQVFVNLIGNALRHTAQGGKISVHFKRGLAQECNLEQGLPSSGSEPVADSSDRRGFWNALTHKENKEKLTRWEAQHWVEITVEDTGEGIPEEELERIFDRFYRIDRARDRESGGTGLGLAIVKEFVQAHGGQIRVKSQLGVGTCFIICLPQKASEKAPNTAEKFP